MSPKSLHENDAPLPQVGALLRFNSYLPRADRLRHRGSRDWDLQGGAVLVGEDRVLTVGHVMQTMPPETALFIPGHGIIPLIIKKKEIVWEHERAREDLDWLVLLRLTEKVTGLAPLRYDYVSRTDPGMKRLTTYGWGDWRVGEDKRHYLADGIQRCRSFDQLKPEGHRYSPLDLAWASRHLKSPFALRNNSGGAVLGKKNGDKVPSLVGVMRAFKGSRHYASRIGTERRDWLLDTLGPNSAQPSTTDLLSIRFSSGMIVLGKSPCFTPSFTLPKGTRKVRVTVSASVGLLVQANVQTSPWSKAECNDLAKDVRCSGRFLYRELAVSAKDSNAHVAVSALAGGPELTDRVEVQVCVACYR